MCERTRFWISTIVATFLSFFISASDRPVGIGIAHAQQDQIGSLIQQIKQHQDSGNLSAATPLIERVVEVTLKRFGPNDMYYVNALMLQAGHQGLMGRAKEGEAVALRALKITRKIVGIIHPEVAQINAQLAIFAQEREAMQRSCGKQPMCLNSSTKAPNAYFVGPSIRMIRCRRIAMSARRNSDSKTRTHETFGIVKIAMSTLCRYP